MDHSGRDKLFTILHKILETEQVLEDWYRAMIVPIHKAREKRTVGTAEGLL